MEKERVRERASKIVFYYKEPAWPRLPSSIFLSPPPPYQRSHEEENVSRISEERRVEHTAADRPYPPPPSELIYSAHEHLSFVKRISLNNCKYRVQGNTVRINTYIYLSCWRVSKHLFAASSRHEKHERKMSQTLTQANH